MLLKRDGMDSIDQTHANIEIAIPQPQVPVNQKPWLQKLRWKNTKGFREFIKCLLDLGSKFSAPGHQCALLLKNLKFVFLSFKKIQILFWEYIYMVYGVYIHAKFR
jgi:hypothetical protein